MEPSREISVGGQKKVIKIKPLVKEKNQISGPVFLYTGKKKGFKIPANYGFTGLSHICGKKHLSGCGSHHKQVFKSHHKEEAYLYQHFQVQVPKDSTFLISRYSQQFLNFSVFKG